jgi:hypothetical protein
MTCGSCFVLSEPGARHKRTRDPSFGPTLAGRARSCASHEAPIGYEADRD